MQAFKNCGLPWLLDNMQERGDGPSLSTTCSKLVLSLRTYAFLLVTLLLALP